MISALTLLEGDCVEQMKRLPAESVHAIVTDPPYFLGFMGQSFDQQDGAHLDPRVAQERHAAWAVETLRVLKPGGYCLAFGGGRTYHRLACALEDAGFAVVDSMHWTYGSGMNKVGMVGRLFNGATDAEKWAGYGGALRPSHEPIIVAQKPRQGTIAANLIRHGTGALNIDGCRSGFTLAADQTSAKPQGQGRWPTNTLLGHTPSCHIVGTHTVKGSRINKPCVSCDMASGYGGQLGGHRPARGIGDDEGNETVQVWTCDESCPVAALDAQAGERKSGTGAVKRRSSAQREGNTSEAYGAESRAEGTPMVSYGDSGGVSRFYPTFDWSAEADDPFLDLAFPGFYCAKASKSEREAGLIKPHRLRLRTDLSPEERAYVRDFSSEEVPSHLLHYFEEVKGGGGRANAHPT